MAKKNKYGLPRYVPEPVRLEIRRRCGFGCVVCGLGLFDYEHFDPEFSKAKVHDPNGMTLLCMQCNQKKARGHLSFEAVKRANDDPAALKIGFAHEWIDVSTGDLTIVVAGVEFRNCERLIMVNGVTVLSVAEPEEEGTPYRISGRFCNNKGDVIFRIDENNWKVNQQSWDVKWVGPRLTVRNAVGDIALILLVESPGRIVVERIDMLVEGWSFKGDLEGLEIRNPQGGGNYFRRVSMSNSFCGVMLEGR